MTEDSGPTLARGKARPWRLARNYNGVSLRRKHGRSEEDDSLHSQKRS
jgi:hypothetical protein